MTKKTEARSAAQIREQLRQFIGTSTYYQHALNRTVVYTEGVQFLAEAAGAYWLVDAIASYFGTPKMVDAMKHDGRLRTLQFWTLERLDKDAGFDAVLVARADSDCEPCIVQYIEYTDFPLDSVNIWAGRDAGNRWVLYLPSEH